jgi:peptide/nickel transport system substrate-binding protein
MCPRRPAFGILLAAALLAITPAVPTLAGGTLRIGLNEDPDVLDPAQGGFFVDRIVFAATCDKLIDTDAKNDFVPQLATAWRWASDGRSLTLTLRDGVRFQDGEVLDADAVKATIARDQTAPESVRKGELKPVSAVEVVDPHTVRFVLGAPYAPLVAVLADRAGMILAPQAMARLGKNVADELPCAGPFKLTQRIPQDRIVVDRFPGYWNAGAIKLDRIVYQPIPNTTVRLVDLKAGQLDMAERLQPTDIAAVRADPKLKLVTATALAYETISLNVAHGPRAATFADPRIRLALAASLDRSALNQVVLAGQFVPSNQFEAPGSRYWDPDHPVPPRGLAKARMLLQQAGVEHPSFTLDVGTDPVAQQAGQVIQAMAGEAGFVVKVQSMEANAAIAAEQAGDYDAALVLWSGRPDPDGNVSIWLACNGFLNWGHYCNPAFDALLAKARSVTDVPTRQALYRKVVDMYLHDMPHIVLYHYRWLWALSAKVSGFTPTPDGLIRPQGIEIAP